MKLSVREIVIFAMLGSLMFASKVAMQALPNIHLLGTFIIVFTVVYRQKALYPIYVYVFLEGFMQGFSAWWLPYLYIWTVLWGAVMLLPKNMPPKVRPFVYMVVGALHGFLFGTLYAPAQALLFGLDFKGMLLWIAAGLEFDLIHGVSNAVSGLILCPLLIKTLQLAEKHTRFK